MNTCRIHHAPVAAITRNANLSVVGNHPLALVRYSCGHCEYVRHDALDKCDIASSV